MGELDDDKEEILNEEEDWDESEDEVEEDYDDELDEKYRNPRGSGKNHKKIKFDDEADKN